MGYVIHIPILGMPVCRSDTWMDSGRAWEFRGGELTRCVVALGLRVVLSSGSEQVGMRRYYLGPSGCLTRE